MQSLFRVSLPVSENSADSATSASSQQTKNVIVCAGWNHSLFLLPSGKVAACGRGSAGALGLEDASEFVSPPRLISDLEDQKVTAIAAGLNHSLFLTGMFFLFFCFCFCLFCCFEYIMLVAKIE